MKKLSLILILFILFLPVVCYAEECDTSKVKISSITLEESNNATEKISATANDKSINLNLNMSDVGDSIKYKFIVKNDSNEDYLLDKKSISSSSDYINYSIETGDNSNIIKAKSSKTVYLNVQYKNKVPDDAFENGVFNDNVNMKVNLTAKTIDNPNTGIKHITFIFLTIIVMTISFIVFKKKRVNKLMLFIIGVIIPFSVNALCKCDISINSNIKIFNQLVMMVEQESEGEISSGDEVSIGGKEHFYVISSNEDETILVAKYNLYVGFNVKSNSDSSGVVLDEQIPKSDSRYGWQSEETINNRQIALVPFSGKKYWQSTENENFFKPEYQNARNESVYNKNLSTVAPIVSVFPNSVGYSTLRVEESDYTIAYYVEPYIKRLKDMGVTILDGNIVSRDQAYSLGCGYSGFCSASWMLNLNYWTGSVEWEGQPSYQNALVTIYNSLSSSSYNVVNSGVRPTITIRTSDIKLLDHEYFTNKQPISY